MLAEDPETGELAYQEVLQTFVRDTDKTIHVKADGIEIETTSEHPFWVEGKGFVNANSLQQGDVLRLATGEKARVESVWEEAKEEKVLVYNLEVAEFPTYFVSELGVLVHNTCNGGGKYTSLDDGLNFSNKASQHMGESGRQVPVQTLQDAIRYGKAMPDPRGSNATMYYTTMYKNGKMYNLEVLYDVKTNTVYHFEYARKAMGNLSAIK